MPENVSDKTVFSKYDKWAAWVAVAIGFSMPISTALDDILLSILIVLWLLGRHFREKLDIALDNPIVPPTLILFGMYILGLFYGDASWEDALESLKRAGNLLLIPVMLSLFKEKKIRHWATWSFLAAMTLTIMISYLIWAGIIAPNALLKGNSYEPCVFKYRITHGLLMAYAAYLFLLKACRHDNKYVKALYGTLGTAALHNVFFMVSSKTGYIVALALVIYFIVSQWRLKGAVLSGLILILFVGIVYNAPSFILHRRVALMFQEAIKWQPGVSDHTSSTGDRLEFLTNSLELVRKNPIFGFGTGGFKEAYGALVRNTKMDPCDNPHNEYLMVTVQLGIIGLALMLWLFTVQWRKAALLPDSFENLAARGLVILVTSASLITSTLIDHTEGLLYVWMSALFFAGWRKDPGKQG